MSQNSSVEAYIESSKRLASEVDNFVRSHAFVSDEDRVELLEVIRDAVSLQGDLNTLLKSYLILLGKIDWFVTKYQSREQVQARELEYRWNENFLYYVNTMQVKDSVAKASITGDDIYRRFASDLQLTSELVEYLKRVQSLLVARKSILEHLSNNLRADLRNERAAL